MQLTNYFLSQNSATVVYDNAVLLGFFFLFLFFFVISFALVRLFSTTVSSQGIVKGLAKACSVNVTCVHRVKVKGEQISVTLSVLTRKECGRRHKSAAGGERLKCFLTYAFVNHTGCVSQGPEGAEGEGNLESILSTSSRCLSWFSRLIRSCMATS